ncbi:hypothetical protein D7X30_10735 [Corallococcus sp. AB011P]|uniref:IS66 family transposase n=1 Tax=Corallococcus sp. AB011P TaxID=2316735 RepID=UPI000EA35A1C|nr:hypothetical protein D7X30_10735 [Corallococcus sp. AB011P]
MGIRVTRLNAVATLRKHVSRIGGELDTLKGQMAALERRVFGRRAEKLPSVAEELRSESPSPEAEAARTQAALAKRRERAALKVRQACEHAGLKGLWWRPQQ